MRIDLRTHPTGDQAAYSRVWFNGEEITRECFLADDETGEVGVYARTPRATQSVEQFKRGDVRIEYAANYVGTE